MSIKEENMTLSQYSTKVKFLCGESQKLDAESAINEARMHRLIIRGLDPKYSGLVIATWGWATKPTFAKLESILVNQDDLHKQMSEVSIKAEENALFTKRRALQGQDKCVRRYNGVGESLGRKDNVDNIHLKRERMKLEESGNK